MKKAKKQTHYRPDAGYAEKTKKKIGSSEWWKPDKKHKNQIRVLPPWDKRGICIVRRVMHFGFEEDGRNRAFPCLNDNEPWLDSSPCPVCHVIEKMNEGDKEEKKAASELTASSARFLVQIIDCNDIESGVQLWAGPLSFGKYFLSLLEDDDIEDITDPEEGYDIYFEVSGSGRATKYNYRLRAKSSPIPYDSWEDGLQDLIKTIEVKDSDGLIELLEDNYGNAFDISEYISDFEEGTEEEEEEEKPKKTIRRKKRKEEEEEEEKPKESKKGKPKKEKGEKEEEAEEEYTAGDIDGMNRRKLLKLVEDEELPIEEDDWGSIKELRQLIIDELGIPPF